MCDNIFQADEKQKPRRRQKSCHSTAAAAAISVFWLSDKKLHLNFN